VVAEDIRGRVDPATGGGFEHENLLPPDSRRFNVVRAPLAG
jgi:hypothetical protein